MKRIVYYFSILLYTASITLIFASCRGTVNTTGSKHFSEDGEYVDKIKTLNSTPPTVANFYLEVSGSMNGFFRSNQATQFKHDVWAVVSDFVPEDGNVFLYAKQNAQAVPMQRSQFRDGMNKGAFVSSASTDVPDMISRMIEETDISQNQVGVLISDMKYDPVGNSALKALISQYSTDIRNIMMKHHNVAVCLITATSEYLDKTGQTTCENSPYYYLVVGNPGNVVFMRNFISTLLNNNKSFISEIEWGIDYLAPIVAVDDEDYLTEISENRSYGDFDEECKITFAFDITNYPWMFEDKAFFAKQLSIKSEEGTEAIVDTKNIKFDITYDDGKQLKRTAIVKVPVTIKNMYDESDVFEITLPCPEIQEPNNEFLNFLGSEDVNDVSTTFSMEGLLGGFYSSMERFKEAKPVHVLISTK